MKKTTMTKKNQSTCSVTGEDPYRPCKGNLGTVAFTF